MNLFTCQARIITRPRLFKYKQQFLLQTLVCLQNIKKGSSWYCIYTKVHGKLAHRVLDIYSKNNFVFIHGNIKIKSKKVYASKKIFKVKKFIVFNVKKIYPVLSTNK